MFGWKLAFVLAAILPVMISVGMLQTRMMTGYAKGGQKALEEGGKVRQILCFALKCVGDLFVFLCEPFIYPESFFTKLISQK